MDSFRGASEVLKAYLHREIGRCNAPGIAIGATNSDRTLFMGTFGHADISSRSALTPNHIFEIGSISKSFSSIVVLQLVEEGLLNLHGPVTDYLPWLVINSSYEPVTLHHLLSHTAGIITGMEQWGCGACDVWDLRETMVCAPPGSFFHYSNSGYKIIGLVLESLLGKPLPSILKERVLDPIGMLDSHAHITNDIRLRRAQGHAPFYDDRPLSMGGRLAPAFWIESETADGSIVSTAPDMCRFIRLLLHQGQPLLMPAGFAMLTQKVMPTGDGLHGDWYGYGLERVRLDDRDCIVHDGGMIGFVSRMVIDPEAELGVIVMANGPADLEHIANNSLNLLRSIKEGSGSPPLPPLVDPFSITNAAEYAGDYQTGELMLRVRAQGERLYIDYQGMQTALERINGDIFYTEHPCLERFALHFRRQEGLVVEITHGPDWFTNAAYLGPTTFETPQEWLSYTGHYRSYNPWYSNFRIVLRKGALYLVEPDSDEHCLSPIGKGLFRVGEDRRSPERIHFDLWIEGRPMRANLSGGIYCRTFTP